MRIEVTYKREGQFQDLDHMRKQVHRALSGVPGVLAVMDDGEGPLLHPAFVVRMEAGHPREPFEAALDQIGLTFRTIPTADE